MVKEIEAQEEREKYIKAWNDTMLHIWQERITLLEVIDTGRLLASPVARPLIEALDYAQRTNTIGSLRQTDVSRTITAPAVLAQSQAPTVIVQENKTLRETLARLNERLNEPFVTVNTVTGDLGIKQAQDDYQRLMNNKSPKNKRK